MSKRTEAEMAISLVERILEGDKRAEGEMVERYNRGMLFMLSHRSGNKAIAEDLTQETWRIIIEKVRAGDLKSPSKLAAYIVQTAKNQLVMYYRNSHQTKLTTEVELDEAESPNDQPHQLVEQHNLAKIVRLLVNELKAPRDRELIMRFYLKEEDKQSICRDFELSELHFNRVLYRARQRFKELWTEHIEAH